MLDTQKESKRNRKTFHLSTTVARLKFKIIGGSENLAGGACGLIRQHTINLT